MQILHHFHFLDVSYYNMWWVESYLFEITRIAVYIVVLGEIQTINVNKRQLEFALTVKYCMNNLYR